MSDNETEITSQSWGSRILESIKGIFVGAILFLASFVLLFWNEGRAVTTAKSLKEGAAAVVSVSADKVDPTNEGKLVHMTGEATTEETLTDPTFGVSAKAIKLARDVEMYQWKEEQHSESNTKIGGSKETKTTYEYKKTWSSTLQKSGDFHTREGHVNPESMKYLASELVAKKVTVGVFTLAASLVGRISHGENLPVTEEQLNALSAEIKEMARLSAGLFYMGKDPATPEIGDMKISFKVFKPSVVSLIARQVGGTFEPYMTRVGRPIEILVMGTSSAADMFKSAEASNNLLTWILRAVGVIAMFIGLCLIFSPFAVLADVLPFLGDLMRMGTGIFAAIISLSLSATL